MGWVTAEAMNPGDTSGDVGDVEAKVPQRILLVAPDPELARDLAMQIEPFGYQVGILTQAAALPQRLEKTLPRAIIMDLALVESEPGGMQTLQECRRSRATPILFLASEDSLPIRLQALRAGGSAYFPQPVDLGRLIDALDELTRSQEPDPYRVLIVEDEPLLAAYYASVLQQANMLTEVVHEPLQIMRPLTEFGPDLILMDVYLPGCEGPELARILRQQEAYVGLSVVFLSIETDPRKQLAAMRRGGDDFLIKPVEPEHLISLVTTRVQRSRTLRSFMVRDSLTGLLNHTHTKEQLEVEVARAQRYHSRLAFAMLDLDRFKRVNDDYGHATGDRVLKSLARLLHRRLRKTDIIGRYGGEEFAVILPETDGGEALRVLDELRRDFSQVPHQSMEGVFSVTFSGGIAVFPDLERNPHEIISTADAALYQAKRQGRNRVILAG